MTSEHCTWKKVMICIMHTLLFIGLIAQSAAALQISKVKATDVGSATATISWETDVASTGKVDYGIATTGKISESPDKSTKHSVVLSDLNPNAKYRYKITAAAGNDTDTSAGFSFTTKEKGEFKGKTDIKTSVPSSEPSQKLPPVVNAGQVTITGTTEANITVRFYVNSERIPSQILDTGKTSVVSGADGTFSATIKLFETVVKGKLGYNKIITEFTDKDNNVKRIERIVIVDKTPPRLFLREIPTHIAKGELPVIGSLSEPGEIIVKIDGKEQTISLDKDLGFNKTIKISGEGSHNVSIIGKDTAGNEQTQEIELFVDSKPCKVELEEKVFQEPQRFSIIRVKGKTSEPNCEVHIINLGTKAYLDIKDVYDVNQIIEEYRAEFEVSVGGFVAGYYKNVKSEDDGSFSGLIALIEGSIGQEERLQNLKQVGQQSEQIRRTARQTNNILIITVDPAGNIHVEKRTAVYDPGSLLWKVGRIITIPNTVYSDNLMADQSQGVSVSVMYDLFYLGPDAGEISDVRVSTTLDGNKLDNMMLRPGPTYARWKPEEKKAFVLTKMKVRPHKGTILDLKKEISGNEILELGTGLQIDFALTSTVSYSYAKAASPTEPVYFKHAIGVETPFDYNKFLTPEMLNKTIEALNTWVELIDTLEDIAEKASYALLAGCVGSTVMNYFEGVGEGDSNLKRTYYICDRIWCPTIPADCGNLQRTVIDNLNNRYVYHKESGQYVNQQDVDKYYYDEASNNLKVKNEYKGKVSGAALSEAEIKKKSGLRTMYTDDTKDKITTYHWVGTADNQRRTGRTNIHQCPEGQYAVEIIEQSKTGGIRVKTNTRAYGPTSGVTKIGYTCTTLKQKDFETSEITGQLGCYEEGPPNYHETKCWPDDANNVNDAGEISPYEDILTSTRCGCVSGVRGHLHNIGRISRGIKKCLQSAMIGEVRAGYCERLFAQFTCDFVASAIKKIMQSSPSSPFSSGEGATLRGNFNAVNDRLQARYKNIIQNRYGVTSDQVVNKACIAAITGDWSDLQKAFKQATHVPVAPVIGPLIPVSRFTAWDPFTGEAAINYYMTIGILSGGQHVTARLRLICDSGAPEGGGKKYCPPGRYVKELRSFVVPPDGSIQENFFYEDTGAQYWYNIVEMEYEYLLGEKVVKKVIRSKIDQRNAMIAQCHWQLFPPMILCDTLGSDSGAIKLDRAHFVPKNKNVYYPGNEVWLKADYRYSYLLAKNTADQPHIYMVYDIRKPDGTYVSNRESLKTDYRINVRSPRNTHVYNIFTVPKTDTPAAAGLGNFVWNVKEVFIGPMFDKPLEPGEGIIVAAQSLKGTNKDKSERKVSYAMIAGTQDSSSIRGILGLTKVALAFTFLKCKQYKSKISDQGYTFNGLMTQFCEYKGTETMFPLQANVVVDAIPKKDEGNDQLQLVFFRGSKVKPTK